MILRTIHWTISFVFWVALALILTGLLKRNRGSAGLRLDERVCFVPRWWFVCAWMFITVRFGFIGLGDLRAGLTEPLQFTTGVLICIGVVRLLFSIPGTINATNEALEEVSWFWRNKRIRWTEIKEVHTEKRGRTVTVIGPGRRRITYTNVYPDRSRFLLEIERHCGNNIPADFPNESVRAASDG